MKNKNWSSLFPLTSCLVSFTAVVPNLSAGATPPILTYSGAHEIDSVHAELDTLLGHARTSLFYGDTTVTVHAMYGDTNKFASYRCDTDRKTSIGASSLPKDKTDEKWIEYATYLLDTLNSCKNWYYAYGDLSMDLTSVKRINLWVPDGHKYNNGYPSGLMLYVIDAILSPTAVSCSGRLEQQMDFGPVKLGGAGGEVATAQLEVVCDRPAHINLSLNNGENVIQGFGGQISLRYERNFEAKGMDPVVIPIVGSMDRIPPTAGDYRWSVPLVISYE
ncbi:TPA: hypothetical protein SLZ59_001096 [Vibrio cholerae]|nr:hypothetical protein [Vibrio cholerae]